jgi:hypothetical protein
VTTRPNRRSFLLGGVALIALRPALPTSAPEARPYAFRFGFDALGPIDPTVKVRVPDCFFYSTTEGLVSWCSGDFEGTRRTHLVEPFEIYIQDDVSSWTPPADARSFPLTDGPR